MAGVANEPAFLGGPTGMDFLQASRYAWELIETLPWRPSWALFQ
jgi:hypothetical protein